MLACLVLTGGGWLWLRDSALVSVNRVSVSGVSGPDAAPIRSALIGAAHAMTTLDVRMEVLRTAVAPFPVVKDLRVSTQFPHGIRIRVIEEVPVGAVLVGGRTIAVAGDGTLLHDQGGAGRLPLIPLSVLPGGARLTDTQSLGAVRVLAAAPVTLLSRVTQVSSVAPHGFVARVHAGPTIYLGDTSRLRAKWAAATAVLADPGAAGALYIDVTDPTRPAAGVVGPPPGTPGSSVAAPPTGPAAVTTGAGGPTPPTGATGSSGSGSLGPVGG